MHTSAFYSIFVVSGQVVSPVLDPVLSPVLDPVLSRECFSAGPGLPIGSPLALPASSPGLHGAGGGPRCCRLGSQSTPPVGACCGVWHGTLCSLPVDQSRRWPKGQLAPPEGERRPGACQSGARSECCCCRRLAHQIWLLRGKSGGRIPRPGRSAPRRGGSTPSPPC